MELGGWKLECEGREAKAGEDEMKPQNWSQPNKNELINLYFIHDIFRFYSWWCSPYPFITF